MISEKTGETFLSVIFVTHGDRISVAKRLLQSLLPYKKESWLEFICVDNGSIPSVTKLIHENYSFVYTITNRENLGTSRAYNKGIRKANGQYLLIINDDTVIPEGMLYKIKNFLLDNPQYSGLALGLMKNDNEYQALRLKIINIKKSHPEKMCRATFIGTGNLLIKKIIIENIGLYDENYFAGNEDMDLSYRLKKAGIKIYYVPKLFIHHLHVYRDKKSKWIEFILARRLSDIYFASKFFPALTIFVRRYAIKNIKKRMGDNLNSSKFFKIKKIIKLRLHSYYNVQKSLLTQGIERTYRLFVEGLV